MDVDPLARVVGVAAGGDHLVVEIVARSRGWALRLPHRTPEAATGRRRRDGARLGAETGLGPRLAFFDPASGVTIGEWIETAPTAAAPEPRRLGRAIARLHGSRVVLEAGVDLAGLGRAAAETTGLAELAAIGHGLARTMTAAVPSHGDLTPGNVLVDADGRTRFIDWDFAAMHDRCWDLAYVIVEHRLDDAATAALLDGYATAVDHDRLLVFRLLVTGIDAAWRLSRRLSGGADDLARARALAARADVIRAWQNVVSASRPTVTGA